MAESVIITGGEGNLATAIAKHFLDKEPAAAVWTPSRQELDVTQESSVIPYMKAHPCDLLICAAGEVDDQLLAKTTAASWDDIFAVNLHGAALCAREAGKIMFKRRCGHVIFISSYSAVHPPIGQVAYASAKAALFGLTKSLAREWGAAQIRVNGILPGFMENAMTASLPASRKEKILQEHVLGHYNTATQAAHFVYLLHKELIHTSGQIINLDSRIL